MIEEYYKFIEKEQDVERTLKKGTAHIEDWDGWMQLFLAKTLIDLTDCLAELSGELK